MKKEKALDIFTNILLFLIVIIFVLPILMMFLTSIQDPMLIIKDAKPHFIFIPNFQNYINLITKTNFMRSLVNSLIVSIGHTALALFISFPAAYSLSRGGSFKSKFWVTLWIMATRCLPPIGMAIPFYIIFQRLGIYNTSFGLMILYLTLNLSFGVMMLKSFLKNVPVELEEAAFIDGASLWTMMTRIILPIIRPGLVATSIFIFTVSWNEFMFAFLFTSFQNKTAPVEISSFITPMGIQWAEMSAAGCLIMSPVIIFAIVIRKYIVSGLTMGAVKG